jgi:hypothetical protein
VAILSEETPIREFQNDLLEPASGDDPTSRGHVRPTLAECRAGLIADLGEEAAWRYVEFFTANIRNPNTRRAYSRACNRFFAWCEDRGLTPAAIWPHDVATYIEQLQVEVSAPSVKQQLAGCASSVLLLSNSPIFQRIRSERLIFNRR